MKSITRTAALNRLATCLLWGIPFDIHPNSLVADVLNDDILNPFVPAPATAGQYIVPEYDPDTETRDLKLGMIMIGRGGHGGTIDDDGEMAPITYPHEATHTGLFRYLPLLTRPVSGDLTGEEKAKYRLRTTMRINNVLYAVYWGKLIDTSSSEIIEVIETVENGKVVSSRPYTPTANDARPEKTDIQQTATGVYLRTYAGINLAFSNDEIEDIVNACELMYGSANKAVISEIAFCFGIDKKVNTMYSEAGTTVIQAPADTYEFVAPHLGTIESTFKPVEFTGGFLDTKNIGVSEPLFGAR